MQQRRDILLPVETSNRELDAKLLLGLFAAEAGYRCHLGTLTKIQAPGFPPSIYVSKSVRFAKAVKLMSGLGHIVISWDEEGLARFKDEAHGARIEAEALRLPRLLLSWGPSNSRLWRAHPLYDGRPIIETGNPRVDLLRDEMRPLHQPKCAEIRARYGDFALLNTNFGLVNHFRPGGRRAKVGGTSHDPEAFIRFRRGAEEHKRRLFRAFLGSLPVVAEGIKPFVLVIRPHPSEDQAPWIEAARGISNIAVVYDGPVIPWELAARCLIHNGCTSAIEASVLRVPALAFRPHESEEFDVALPNALSEQFATPDGLAERAREILSAAGKVPDNGVYGPLLRDNVAALEGPFACERIVAALGDGLGDSSSSPVFPLFSELRAYGKFLYRKARRAVSKDRRNYEEHKSRADHFTLADVAARMALMAGALGRFRDVQVKEHSPGVVTLYQ